MGKVGNNFKDKGLNILSDCPPTINYVHLLMKKNSSRFFKRSRAIGMFFLSILAVFFFNMGVALAHSPHDDIFDLELSPTYEQDRTVFIVVRGNLLKSEDGGSDWQRILNGLDNQSQLSSLAISSQSRKTLFLASHEDGIYKSQDEGNSWAKVNHGLENLNIDLVSIAPNSDEIVFATGVERGLYKTENGGETWKQVIDGNQKITAVAFIPQQNEQIIIGDRQGILYSSKNGGKTWEELFRLQNSGAIRTLAISPNFFSDKTFFVGTEKRGIFKTVDGGKTFEEVNEGVSDKSISSIAFSPNYTNDLTLYASTWKEGVFQSNNGGKNWKKSSQGLTRNHQADQIEYQRPHFSKLKIANTSSPDKTLFLAGFNGLFQSTNGGGFWKEMDTLSASLIQGIALSPNYQNDSSLAITTYLGGAYLSKDGGLTWKAINQGLQESRGLKYIARLFNVEFSPNYSADNTLFSSSWTHFLKSTDSGEKWQEISLSNGSIWQDIFQKSWWLNKPKTEKPVAVISPNFKVDKTIYFASLKGEFFKSTDGGQKFSIIAHIERPVKYLVISPNFEKDKTLYAAISDDSGAIYKTVDGGHSWESTGYNLDLIKSDRIQLAISPDYGIDQTVFAVTERGLFESKDGGKSWQKLLIVPEEKGTFVEAIALSPDYYKDRTFIATIRGMGMFKTEDGGKSFTQIGKELLANNHVFSYMDDFPFADAPIEFSPMYSLDRTIYGFSGTELFKSTDGGNTWENLPVPQPKLINPVIYYFARLNSSPIFRFIEAAIVAILGYLFLGKLKLNKDFLFRKWKIKIAGAFVAFLGTFIFLSTWTF